MDKINNHLKVNSGQMLSLNEMDNVSGGVCNNAKDIKTKEDLYDYVYNFIGIIEKKAGRGVAASIMLEQFSPREIKDFESYMVNVYCDGGCNLRVLYDYLSQIVFN